MISLRNLTFARAGQPLVSDASLQLHPGYKVGLTGGNGCGKSSFFALFSGALHAESGDLDLPASWVIAHVAQETPSLPDPALEFTLDGDRELRQVEADLKAAEAAHDGERIAALHARYGEIGGYGAKARAAELLHGLGFTDADFTRPVKEFSGGWRVRLNLARALMCRSDLLLLDEPTNHLDLPSLRWLENFLNDTTATVAVISHDRYFLDGVATSILEIEAGRSRAYEGNYSEFMEKKEQELEIAERHFEQQQGYIKRQEEYIRRNIAGQNTKMAQGRRTHLAKLQRIDKPLRDRRRIKFSFPETQRSGDTALVLEKVTVGWDGVPLFAPIEHLQVKRGQKLAIVGFNGTGKSTLLKAIADEISFMTGVCRLGSQVKLGYFDQHHRNLDPRNTVFQQIQGVIPMAPKQDVLGFLAKFQFRGDDVDKPVTVLSGGERARLSIATLIREGVNLLMLDEPTNHMDIHSMEAMEDTILSFTGAVVLVTHDRYLLGRVSDSLLRIHEGKAEFREGSYEDHQAWVDLDLGQEPSDDEGPKVREKEVPKPKDTPKASAAPVKPVAIDKERQRTLKRLERLVGEAEAKVAELEAKAAVLNGELVACDPADWKQFQEKTDALKAIEMELAYAMAEWEERQRALEEI